MGGDIAFEQDAKRRVVGDGNWVLVHSADQVPTEAELEELTEDVEHAVVGVGGVLEAAVGVDPVEELEGALPVVAVRGEGSGDCVGVEVGKLRSGWVWWVGIGCGGEWLRCGGAQKEGGSGGAKEKKEAPSPEASRG